MNIGIQTWGSHGDIRPFIALAEGLQKAGHQVTLYMTSVVDVEYSTSISKSGVNIEQIASDIVNNNIKNKDNGNEDVNKNPQGRLSAWEQEERRMKKINEEVSHWNEYDYVVVNDDLELWYNQIFH